MDHIELHGSALAHLHRVAAEVGEAQWDDPSNCPPWTLAQVLGHALGAQLLWVGAVTGSERIGVRAVMDPAPVTGDRLGRIAEVTAEATATWAGDGVLDRDLAGPFGVLPGRTSIVFPTLDPLCHAWDLAISAGLPPDIPDDLLEAAEPLVEHAVNDTTRGYGLFADAPALAPDATRTDRFIARTGRHRPGT